MSNFNQKEIEMLSSQSEFQIANKTATQALTLICSIISLAYIMEVVKGSRTWLYVLVAIILAMAPVVISWILYNKDHESKMIMHVVTIGFAIMYCYLLFTANNDLVFTYAIPMMIIVTLYGDLRYTIMLGIGVATCNIISIIIRLVGGDVTQTQIVNFEIQGLLVVLIVIYFIWVSKKTTFFEKIRMARLGIEQNKTSELLQDVLEISGRMADSVNTITDEMETLKSTVGDTLNSMSEVNSGTGESASAVQNQLTQTEEIQKHVDSVKDAASTIHEDVETTAEEVKKGQVSIGRMDELAAAVHDSGKEVADALSSFQDTASKMNSITELINSVASQTSLLALNASIEAARAGEAGKGFAVVASEISNLAGQTTSATEDINSLIDSITSQIDNIVHTIDELLETGEEESRCAEEATENFNTIADKVHEITERSDDMARVVENLARANTEIINTVQTISSITEEVNAHASQTYSISEENQRIVSHINELVGDLNSDATALMSHR